MLGQDQPEPPRKRGTVPVDAGVEDVLSEFAPGGDRVDSQHLEGPPLVSRSPENSLSLPHAPRTILNIVDLGNEAIAPLFGVGLPHLLFLRRHIAARLLPASLRRARGAKLPAPAPPRSLSHQNFYSA